ncbi:uncharacterized protein [Littorina saxatilis]|uniref:C2H2-type domain-containing protein n=1 Tax=Littorina saxatilis TaxID=31220 RepID=A0AAN9BFV4_9CAEN
MKSNEEEQDVGHVPTTAAFGENIEPKLSAKPGLIPLMTSCAYTSSRPPSTSSLPAFDTFFHSSVPPSRSEGTPRSPDGLGLQTFTASDSFGTSTSRSSDISNRSTNNSKDPSLTVNASTDNANDRRFSAGTPIHTTETMQLPVVSASEKDLSTIPFPNGASKGDQYKPDFSPHTTSGVNSATLGANRSLSDSSISKGTQASHASASVFTSLTSVRPLISNASRTAPYRPSSSKHSAPASEKVFTKTALPLQRPEERLIKDARQFSLPDGSLTCSSGERFPSDAQRTVRKSFTLSPTSKRGMSENVQFSAPSSPHPPRSSCSSLFRPVGVILTKNASSSAPAVATSVVSSCSSLAGQCVNLGSTYLYCCSPQQAVPRTSTSSVRSLSTYNTSGNVYLSGGAGSGGIGSGSRGIGSGSGGIGSGSGGISSGSGGIGSGSRGIGSGSGGIGSGYRDGHFSYSSGSFQSQVCSKNRQAYVDLKRKQGYSGTNKGYPNVKKDYTKGGTSYQIQGFMNKTEPYQSNDPNRPRNEQFQQPNTSSVYSVVLDHLPTIQNQNHRSMTEEQAEFVGGGHASMQKSTTGLRGTSFAPHVEYSRREVKQDPFGFGGDSVGENVSVVTIPAPDTSLYMANHGGTTSQTESEFSLQDVKMQLIVSTSASDISLQPLPPPSEVLPPLTLLPPPPPPLPPSPSTICHDNQPPSYDVADESHPGLDMLSDVSVLVGSMTSQNGARPKKCSRGTNSDSYQTTRETESLPSAPAATYIGTINGDRGSNGAVNRSQAHDDAQADSEASYTLMAPAPLLQSAGILQGCSKRDLSHYKMYTTKTQPKPPSRFTVSPVPDPLYVRDSGEIQRSSPSLVLKIQRQVIASAEGTTVQRGRPRKKVESEKTSRQRGEVTKKRRGRPKKTQQDQVFKAVSADAPGLKNMAAQQTKPTGKTPAYQIKPPQMRVQNASGDCWSQTDGCHGFKFTSSQQNSKRATESNPVTFNTLDLRAVDTSHTRVSMQKDSPSQKGRSRYQPTSDAQKGNTASHTQTTTERCTCGQGGASSVNTQTVSLPSSQSVVVSSGNEKLAWSASSSTVTRPEDNQIIDVIKTHQCPDFDPLVIAEEEVTSTEPDEDANPNGQGTKRNRRPFHENSQAVQMAADRLDTSKARRRGHICVSCFSIPSSSSDESASPAFQKADLHSLKKKKSVGKLLKLLTAKKHSEAKENQGLPCEICGRKYSTPQTLTRHKRVFHPSLFSPNATYMELPLMSPFSPRLPLSPSSLHSAMSSEAQASQQSHASLQTEQDGNTSTKRTKNQAASSPDRKSMGWDMDNSENEMWEPKAKRPKKKKKRKKAIKKEFVQKNAATVEGEQKNVKVKGKGRGKFSWPKRGKMAMKTRQRSRSYYSGMKGGLNFRTKKRTRINSTIPCPYCDSFFSVMSNLKRHTGREHNDVNVFVCNICCHKFNMRRTLKKHIREQHIREFPFCCPECLDNFRSEKEAFEHRKRHDICTYPCDDCKLLFYTEEHFGEHMATHHITLSANHSQGDEDSNMT